MAEFNKIYSDSSIIVSYEPSATLCFNNGKVISKSKFALEDHTLTLFEDTSDTVSVFYNNGIANTYEFDTRLYQDNVQLSTIDKYENRIENLNKNSILVFIDGMLESASNYTVIEGNRLVILNKKTNDNNKIFHIIVYLKTIHF